MHYMTESAWAMIVSNSPPETLSSAMRLRGVPPRLAVVGGRAGKTDLGRSP
jgi:hypothetical protein